MFNEIHNRFTIINPILQKERTSKNNSKPVKIEVFGVFFQDLKANLSKYHIYCERALSTTDNDNIIIFCPTS